jgi:hypothetical protein
MNRKLINAACLALILAGCGDKNDSATGSAEPGMMDKAMDSAGEVVEGAGDMASDEVDATKEPIPDAAQGVADATATEAEDTETKEALEFMDKEMEKASESMGQ